MNIVDHDSQPREPWRPGVTTRMWASSAVGSAQLCIFEQWCDPGAGAPTHLHAVEETLTVLKGRAEFWLDGERALVTRGQSVIVPAGLRHGFRNVGDGMLHVQAILAAPIFEAAFDDARETPRRWSPASPALGGGT
jgi:quercetin dioxygenase-like cupin family protein